MKYTVIGMISGTSHDGIDACVADFDLVGDEIRCHPRGLYSRELSPELRTRVATALPPHATTLEEVCRLDTEIGQLFGDVAVVAQRDVRRRRRRRRGLPRANRLPLGRGRARAR